MSSSLFPEGGIPRVGRRVQTSRIGGNRAEGIPPASPGDFRGTLNFLSATREDESWTLDLDLDLVSTASITALPI